MLSLTNGTILEELLTDESQNNGQQRGGGESYGGVHL